VKGPWKPSRQGAWGKAGRKQKSAPREIARAFARAGQVRAKVVFYGLALLAVFLIGKLYVVQVREGPLLAARARDQRLETVALAARRGTIFDRDMTPLVRSLPSQSVYATPHEVIDKATTARRLGTTLGLPSERILARLRGSEGGGTVLLARKVEGDAAERVGKLALAGVTVVQEETGVRFLPSGRLASTLLGFTGIDENGLDGVEYAFDRCCAASPVATRWKPTNSGVRSRSHSKRCSFPRGRATISR